MSSKYSTRGFKAALAAFITMSIVSSTAFASGNQDLAAVAGTLYKNIKALSDLLTIISYIAGIAFAIAGVVQFKAHKDNPGQVPLSKPIVYLGVGAALLFLPSIITTAGSTVFGSSGGTSAGKGLGASGLEGG